MKKNLLIVLLLMVIAFVSVTTITYATNTINMNVGEKKTLSKKVVKKAVKFMSSEKKVASISKKGVIKAKKSGTTIITVKKKKKTLKYKIVVKEITSKNNNTVAGATIKEPSDISYTTVMLYKLAKAKVLSIDYEKYNIDLLDDNGKTLRFCLNKKQNTLEPILPTNVFVNGVINPYPGETYYCNYDGITKGAGDEISFSEIKAGEMIEFVYDCHNGPTFDEFGLPLDPLNRAVVLSDNVNARTNIFISVISVKR